MRLNELIISQVTFGIVGVLLRSDNLSRNICIFVRVRSSIGNLSMQRFLATDGNQKCAVLLFNTENFLYYRHLFNLSPRYHIYIVKCLFSSREDYSAGFGIQPRNRLLATSFIRLICWFHFRITISFNNTIKCLFKIESRICNLVAWVLFRTGRQGVLAVHALAMRLIVWKLESVSKRRLFRQVRKPEVKIPHTRTVLSLRFSN